MMVCPKDCIAVTGRGLNPSDIRPLPPDEDRATADTLEALMRSRRSVRFFTDEEVSREDLDRIVAMAATAPMGIPPWDIGVTTIRGRENVRRVVGEVVKGYEGFLKIFRPWVLRLMRPFIGKEQYDMFSSFVTPLAKSYVESWQKGRDVLFYDAPALLLFHHSPYADALDASIACTYAMLAAESLGLGNTIIGGAPPIIQRDKALSKSLGIPEGSKAAIALIVGHPDVRFRKSIHREFTRVNRIA